MFRTKLTRLFQIVLLSGILLSHIEIASAQSTGGGQAQLVEGRAIIVRQGKEMEIDSYPLDFKDQDLIQTFVLKEVPYDFTIITSSRQVLGLICFS